MRCWSYFFPIAVLAAQTQTGEVTSHDQTPTFQSSVNLVRVPVVVRDKAGHTVGGLQKSDFHLTDLGKPQEIAQFSLEGNAVAKTAERQTKAEIPGEPAAGAKPVAPTRFVAFVFDDVHLTAEELANVRVAALKHVEQGIPPEERVGILTLSGNVSMELTNDVAKFRDSYAFPSGQLLHGDAIHKESRRRVVGLHRYADRGRVVRPKNAAGAGHTDIRYRRLSPPNRFPASRSSADRQGYSPIGLQRRRRRGQQCFSHPQ
jgi:hypothetical protein